MDDDLYEETVMAIQSEQKFGKTVKLTIRQRSISKAASESVIHKVMCKDDTFQGEEVRTIGISLLKSRITE